MARERRVYAGKSISVTRDARTWGGGAGGEGTVVSGRRYQRAKGGGGKVTGDCDRDEVIAIGSDKI